MHHRYMKQNTNTLRWYYNYNLIYNNSISLSFSFNKLLVAALLNVLLSYVQNVHAIV